MTRTTRDSISMRGSGVVHIEQPAQGHRFTLDSILLADFCRIRPKDRVLEPGGGTGIISLLLAKKHPRSVIYPVEVRQDLHALCEANRRANGLDNVVPLRQDIRNVRRSHCPHDFDAIILNPPYVRSGRGRVSPDPARRAARQDLLGGIEHWLDLQRFLKQGGRCSLVFPAARFAELCAIMRMRRLEPKRLRSVHSHGDEPASLVLVEAVKDGTCGLEILPPLIVHARGGKYTRELQDIYGTPD